MRFTPWEWLKRLRASVTRKSPRAWLGSLVNFIERRPQLVLGLIAAFVIGVMVGIMGFGDQGPPPAPEKAPVKAARPTKPDLHVLTLAVDEALFAELRRAGATDTKVVSAVPLGDPTAPKEQRQTLRTITDRSPLELAAALRARLNRTIGALETLTEIRTQEDRIVILVRDQVLRTLVLLPPGTVDAGDPPCVEIPGMEGCFEEIGPYLSPLVNAIDNAMLELLRTLEATDIAVLSSTPLPPSPENGSRTILRQEMQARAATTPTAFADALRNSLGPVSAAWTEVRALGDRVEVYGHGQLLRTLVLLTPKGTSKAPSTGPKLAIVIDDLGQSTADARRLAALPFPVAFAIWPYGKYRTQVTEIAQAAGLDVLLHMPMEPQGYPEKDPGPGALFLSMSTPELQATLKRSLDALPAAIGVNNHMGSCFTADAGGMRTVLTALRERGLFFLDSLTCRDSAVLGQARAVGIPAYQRDVFLDNVRTVDAILERLAEAEAKARQSGQAVAIGHGYRETQAALEKWATRRDTRVSVVNLSSMKPLVQPAATTARP